jgi:transposase
MRENITLNPEEQKRLYVLNQVIEGKLTASKAAGLLRRSVRQIRRSIAEYRRRGATALIHGNRGQPPANRVPKQTVNRIVKLARGAYSGFNQQHFTEMLAEREGIVVSRSSVRRILAKAGIGSPRRRRSTVDCRQSCSRPSCSTAMCRPSWRNVGCNIFSRMFSLIETYTICDVRLNRTLTRSEMAVCVSRAFTNRDPHPAGFARHPLPGSVALPEELVVFPI